MAETGLPHPTSKPRPNAPKAKPAAISGDNKTTRAGTWSDHSTTSNQQPATSNQQQTASGKNPIGEEEVADNQLPRLHPATRLQPSKTKQSGNKNSFKINCVTGVTRM